jgi:hypothetical protein
MPPTPHFEGVMATGDSFAARQEGRIRAKRGEACCRSRWFSPPEPRRTSSLSDGVQAAAPALILILI